MTLRDEMIVRITDEGEIFSYDAGCRAADAIVALLWDFLTRENIVTTAAGRLPTHENDFRHPVEVAGDVIAAALDAALGEGSGE